jgi:hypothetical protein
MVVLKNNDLNFCPYCEVDVGSTSELFVHQLTPLKMGFPSGLVYFNPSHRFYGIITDGGDIESGVNRPREYIHTRNHFVVKYDLFHGKFDDLAVVRNLVDLKKRFQSGAIRLLTSEEFSDFSEVYDNSINDYDSFSKGIHFLLRSVPSLVHYVDDAFWSGSCRKMNLEKLFV